MKLGKAATAAFYLRCPHCDEENVAPDGSLMHTPEESPIGQSVKCVGDGFDGEGCGKRFRIPARASM